MTASILSVLQAKKMFIAYYGRPADAEGLEYWSNRIEEEGASVVADAFGASEEFSANYGHLGITELISGLYQQLFGRTADEDGLDYYVREVLMGRFSVPNVALAIIDGIPIGSDDETTVANRVLVADYLMDNMPESVFRLDILDDVTSNFSTVNEAYALLDSERNDDFPSAITTSGSLLDNGQVSGIIEFDGDDDWFGISLQASNRYTFDLVSTDNNSGLTESRLAILDDQGNVLITESSGAGNDIALPYTPSADGNYFISVRGVDDALGSYRVESSFVDAVQQSAISTVTPIRIAIDDSKEELESFQTQFDFGEEVVPDVEIAVLADIGLPSSDQYLVI
ncbi:DUF4214 domain-containing protein [Motiliproteus sp. MSK22-1]|uniref:DUF4214 domain-containing protein n=1 Tax=Motiliproteus sp. MSK22-1 TaxID=1897630 RepID=UPI000976266F|nr:DUF4214 domain-containing protein [Motiliproteus sp. MSK22-1]OMH26634.1 hypothetical protein BGP75_23340 [Motiliproteus sp. MSK22-1]